MKTITELPTIPEGWRWCEGPRGWTPMNPALCAAVTWLAAAMNRDPGFGTPPAGSIVWDARSIEYVIYQPEAV
jgi:hypothetical protein